jgi:prepilin-type N-terminal cleavage/methylation domain-containing protein
MYLYYKDTKMHRHKINNMKYTVYRRQGFTLVELLVAVGLMAMIMTIVGVIFTHITRGHADTIETLTIYLNARTSLDQIETDILGCLPLSINMQKFSLESGKYLDMAGNENSLAKADKSSADKINLRTFTSAGGVFQGVDLTYILGEEKDPTILVETGGTGKTIKTHRQLYALYRIPKMINKDGTVGPLIGDAQSDPKEREAAMALCHYVLSFNIEYFDSTRKQFREIKDHWIDPKDNRDVFEWPIGDDNPPGEQLHRGLRVNLRVIANAAERSERMFSKVIWIPVGY